MNTFYYQQKLLNSNSHNKGMDFTSANKLISEIRDLRRDIQDIITGMKQARAQESLAQASKDMLAYIKPWLSNGCYDISLKNINSSVKLIDEGEEKLIVGIRKFVETSETLPLNIQINSVLIKNIHDVSYNPDTDIITIILACC